MIALTGRNRFNQRTRARFAKKLSSLCGARGSLWPHRNTITHATRSSRTELRTFFVLTAHLAVILLGLSGYWHPFQENCLIAEIHIYTAVGFTIQRGLSKKRDLWPGFRSYQHKFARGLCFPGGALSGTSTWRKTMPPQNHPEVGFSNAETNEGVND